MLEILCILIGKNISKNGFQEKACKAGWHCKILETVSAKGSMEIIKLGFHKLVF